MTATMDYRRSDHQRESRPPRARQESLCLSEFVDEILQNDADILRQADDFMHLFPVGDDIANIGNLDPFSNIDGEDIESVFVPLGDSSSSSETPEDVVDVESVDSSENVSIPTGSSTDQHIGEAGIGYSSRNYGCARTVGVLPHHYGEMKVRLRASAEAASFKKKNADGVNSQHDNNGIDQSAGNLLPLFASPTKYNRSKIELSLISSPALKEKRKPTSRKSLRKRHRRRIPKAAATSSPVEWRGAHTSTTAAPYVPPQSPAKLPSGRADSCCSSDSRCGGISSSSSTDKNNNNENSNSLSCDSKESGKMKGSQDTLATLSESNSNSSTVATRTTSSCPTESVPRLRLDGLLVSPSRQVKTRQKVVTRSLVEKLKAAAQRATARQSILLPVPTSKPAEHALVSLDHDYCSQRQIVGVDRDNLEPEPMDVDSDEEQNLVRIEVLPDLSLAKRQSGGFHQSMNNEASLLLPQPLQKSVGIIVHQKSPQSLLKFNQRTEAVLQVSNSQKVDHETDVVSIPGQSKGTVMIDERAMWTSDGCTMPFKSGMGSIGQVLSSIESFVEEEEVVATTTPSEGALSDSGVESLDRRKESRERDEADFDDGIVEDGRESRRWREEKARRIKKRDANNNNINKNGNSGSDALLYRGRRRRSGSATSNSSFSSTDSGRSRSRSSECRCASGDSRRSRIGRQISHDRPLRDGSSHKRSLSRQRNSCRRCRDTSPDYTVGSHASRHRDIQMRQREAYVAAGWETNESSSKRPITQKRERKNIWCMDAQVPSPNTTAATTRPQSLTAMQEALEKIRRGGDRKIIYVGKIPEGTTRVQIREWFSRFGKIAEVSLHFRDAGENYGFITFDRAEDAYRAVEQGNNDPGLPKFQLCFGGRRQFCGQQWSDLDSQPEKDYLRERVDDLVKKNDDDFDSLLKSLKGAPLSGVRRR
ncbi:hypothetical protein BIW11_08123 [Tropilaelaps mercedesae]|uniref:RRM domain-containing protein n=1 Tax=Tropilaelaps mercedesae TaxID=418985 RepID=A0A1V9XQY2_9ACAR|nr:hypothetical protein BIW11_08123 [Tropilaelaps mercedesae]